MGMDLDLAVDHPESGFDDVYRARFAARVAVARAALAELGVALPEPRALPRRFRFRVSLGSYRAAWAWMARVEEVARAVAPGGADHLCFVPGALFVPVAFARPIHTTGAGEPLAIASAPHALASLQAVGTELEATTGDPSVRPLLEATEAATRYGVCFTIS